MIFGSKFKYWHYGHLLTSFPLGERWSTIGQIFALLQLAMNNLNQSEIMLYQLGFSIWLNINALVSSAKLTSGMQKD